MLINMNIKELAKRIDEKNTMVSGHRTCAGCPIAIICRTVTSASDNPVVCSSATSCAEVTTTIYPQTSWNIPWIHSVFANAAATISGIETAYKAQKKKGKIKKDINFLVIAGDGGCYIPKTKILTTNGFKNVEDLTAKDIVWSVNPNNLNLETSEIIKMHKYDYKDKIVKVNHNWVHFDVTLEHNVPVYNKFNKKVEVIKAKQLLNYGRSDKINIICGDLNWVGKTEKYFVLPTINYSKGHNREPLSKIPIDVWVEFLGYWLSEGHLSIKSKTRNVYSTFISQTKKSGIDKIKSCLLKLPLNHWYSQDRFIISNQQLWTYLKQFGKAKDKFIPSEIKNLPKKQLQTLFDALILGDGTIVNYKDCKAYRFTTISKQLKDDFIEVSLKLGYRTHLDSRTRKNRPEYTVIAYDYKPTTLANLRKSHITSYDYNGKIYCPELRKNHILIIEKDGRISLNMNSFDIGLQALSGALERGHDFVFLCYDNEGYMNTGNQRSSATPKGASTTTTPSGSNSFGKMEFSKDLVKIAMAHNVPYVAQANTHNLIDLYNKAQKAFSKKGPAVIVVFAACPTNMKAPSEQTIAISKLATESNFWPLYEYEDGKLTINYKPEKRIAIEEFLKTQTKFKEVLKPKNKEILKSIQEEVDKRFNDLLKLEKL